jgi:hypothetical protein
LGYSSSMDIFLDSMLEKAKMDGIRTLKNSSRLDEKIDRKEMRLYSGTVSSAASINTRWLKRLVGLA